jgi:aminocarboxymuconate-semialdehyde decarboxylase
MRIDAYTHFMPSRMFTLLVDSGYPDIGKRMREVPCIYDIDLRKKVVDTFKDYAQIISYAMPPLESFAKGDGVKANEYAKLINDEFAEICAKDNDHFPGWVAQIALNAPDAGVGEAKRAIAAGALGVQIYTNIAGKPLDEPEFEPAGVLQDHGQIPEAENHHAPLRRHHADAGRPHRPRLGSARRAHVG